jgi:putative transposase
MATSRMDITSFVGKLLEQDDGDALREGVRVLAQAVMETEVSGQIGAGSYGRSSERTAYRNGYRTRTWDTRVDTIELKIPKVTAGTYFPSLLEPRRRAEKALQAVVVEAYVKGISTRKVDDLVKALGIDGISKSEVSRICKVLDTEVKGFLGRPIEAECPYVWLDATFHKIREAGRVISVATVVAIGVTTTGERTVLGAATGPSEDHQFWMTFLRQLVKRGLRGVRLVISDAHEGLRQAIAKILHEATWQRCRVHFMRNLLSTVPKQAQDAVAAIVRTVFSQPDQASAMAQLHDVARMLEGRFPQAAELLEDAAKDVLGHLHFPREHRRRLHSTNSLERLHKRKLPSRARCGPSVSSTFGSA